MLPVKCLRTHNADSCEYFSVPSQLKHATQLFSGTPCLKGRLMKAQQPKDVTSKARFNVDGSRWSVHRCESIFKLRYFHMQNIKEGRLDATFRNGNKEISQTYAAKVSQ